jgi:hypothetical protein
MRLKLKKGVQERFESRAGKLKETASPGFVLSGFKLGISGITPLKRSPLSTEVPVLFGENSSAVKVDRDFVACPAKSVKIFLKSR